MIVLVISQSFKTKLVTTLHIVPLSRVGFSVSFCITVCANLLCVVTEANQMMFCFVCCDLLVTFLCNLQHKKLHLTSNLFIRDVKEETIEK